MAWHVAGWHGGTALCPGGRGGGGEEGFWHGSQGEGEEREEKLSGGLAIFGKTCEHLCPLCLAFLKPHNDSGMAWHGHLFSLLLMVVFYTQ